MADRPAKIDFDAALLGFQCEPGAGLTIQDDIPSLSQGSRWLSWGEVVRLHSWLGQQIQQATHEDRDTKKKLRDMLASSFQIFRGALAEAERNGLYIDIGKIMFRLLDKPNTAMPGPTADIILMSEREGRAP